MRPRRRRVPDPCRAGLAIRSRATDRARCRARWTTPRSLPPGSTRFPPAARRRRPCRARSGCSRTPLAEFGSRSLAEVAAAGDRARPRRVRGAPDARHRRRPRASARSVTIRCSVRSTSPVVSRSRRATPSSTACSPSASPTICEQRRRTCCYDGELARAVVDRLRAGGGFLTEEDFAAHTRRAIEPVATTFRGSTVWELPPPTQGVAVIHALDAIGASSTRSTTPDDWCVVMERWAAAMATRRLRPQPDRGRGRRRPRATRPTSPRSISEGGGGVADHERVRRLRRPPRHPRARRPDRQPGDDAARPAAADEAGPQAAAHDDPCRRHTRRRAADVLGVAGGFMQPQAQVQILVHMLERGLAPQAAIDEPRFRIGFGGVLALEAGHPLCDAMPDAAASTARTRRLRRRPGRRHRPRRQRHRRRRPTPRRRRPGALTVQRSSVCTASDCSDAVDAVGGAVQHGGSSAGSSSVAISR